MKNDGNPPARGRRHTRAFALALLLACGPPVGAAAAGIANVAGAAAAIRRTTTIPVFLPRALPDSIVGGAGLRLTVVTSNASSYEAAIATRRGCVRPACRLGFVRGARAGTTRVSGDLVRLGNGRTASYEAATCAAGCTMSTLAWRDGNDRYELGLRGASLVELRSSAASFARY
jgi:hypothetical protein